VITWTTKADGQAFGEREAWVERLGTSLARGIRTSGADAFRVLITSLSLAEVVSLSIPGRRTSHEDLS
jgi:hypothetical protein